MSRTSKLLAGVCVAAGMLLGYAAASGHLNPAQWAKAAPGHLEASENPGATEDDSSLCCFGTRRRQVVVVAADEPRAAAAPREEEPKPEFGKGKRAQAFIAAFEKGDAKAVASFWTENADYVDETGREYKGRAAIQKMYEKFFADKKGLKLNIIVTSVRPVGTDVMLEDGITEVTTGDSALPSSARFSAVLVKKDGEWYLESVRDSIPHPPSNAEHFDDIEWLLGEWTGEVEKGESAKATYNWAENRNFIVSSFATTLDGVPVVGGTQWIAWDAVDKQIRSYSFYSGGGVGEAVWTKEGDAWMIKVNARTAAGKKASATNILKKTDNDHATWQMTKLTVDGQTMPDAKPVKMKRVKPPQP